MTESEWLTCDDPANLWVYLMDLDRLHPRKFRLFGCACVRDVWHDLPHDALRGAILVCEKFSDGETDLLELNRAREAVHHTYERSGDIVADHSAISITELCLEDPSFPMGTGSAAGIAAVAAEIRFDQSAPWHVAHEQVQRLHGNLFRDIFGNPFRPVTFAPEWRTEPAVGIAAKMYDARDFGNMPVLADALEDAGCDDPDILAHCRGDGPHARGCWVVDLVLGKA